MGQGQKSYCSFGRPSPLLSHCSTRPVISSQKSISFSLVSSCWLFLMTFQSSRHMEVVSRISCSIIFLGVKLSLTSLLFSVCSFLKLEMTFAFFQSAVTSSCHGQSKSRRYYFSAVFLILKKGYICTWRVIAPLTGKFRSRGFFDSLEKCRNHISFAKFYLASCSLIVTLLISEKRMYLTQIQVYHEFCYRMV